MKINAVAAIAALGGCCLFASSTLARSIVEVPGPTPNPGTITAITTVSDADVWSVGYHVVNGNNVGLTQHWDGTLWSVVPDAMPRNPYSFFYGTSATSSSDVWAAGYSVDENGIVIANLIEHWDGTSWTVVPSPGVASHDNILYAIDALTTADVWSVGYVDTIRGNHFFTPGALHWDGTAWSVVSPPATAGATLAAVHMIASNDVWAVGGSAAGTYTLHWDGTTWSVIPSPNGAGAISTLRGVSGTAANDVWAVGVTGPSYTEYSALAMHWDGTAWTVVPTATTSDLDPLSAVTAISSRNVIAAGSVGGEPLLERWNGRAWSIVPTPPVDSGGALTSVSAGSKGSLWSSGSQTSGELFLKLAR